MLVHSGLYVLLSLHSALYNEIYKFLFALDRGQDRNETFPSFNDIGILQYFGC